MVWGREWRRGPPFRDVVAGTEAAVWKGRRRAACARPVRAVSLWVSSRVLIVEVDHSYYLGTAGRSVLGVVLSMADEENDDDLLETEDGLAWHTCANWP